eukprot:GHVL01042903.1.p1 GENE.GHVL01042903.1~~GHVL01042903.1.p1  ORF type:complete len:620 (+),score=137.70 GHVL01042903.1:162-1862(+)
MVGDFKKIQIKSDDEEDDVKMSRNEARQDNSADGHDDSDSSNKNSEDESDDEEDDVKERTNSGRQDESDDEEDDSDDESDDESSGSEANNKKEEDDDSEEEEDGQESCRSDGVKTEAATSDGEKNCDPIEKMTNQLETMTVEDKPMIEEAGFVYNEKLDCAEIEVPKNCSVKRPFRLSIDKYKLLLPHQKVGVAFMWKLFAKEAGGVLADDMGLGKTVQTCTFLRGLRASRLAKRVIILCPVTLVDTWKRELIKWTGKGYDVVTLDSKSSLRERSECMSFVFEADDGRKEGAILLLGYPLMKNHACQLSGSIDGKHPNLPVFEESWDVIVMDEAHCLKNHTTQVAKNARLLPARCRILLTGTPLQNKTDELWSIMDIAQPGLLGDYKSFKSTYAAPIAKANQKNATHNEVLKMHDLCRQLRTTIEPAHFLRRDKTQVLTEAEHVEEEVISADASPPKRDLTVLPPKIDAILWIRVTENQELVYRNVLAEKVVSDARKRGEAGYGSAVLQAVAILKKICNHPVLLLPVEKQSWRNPLSNNVKILYIYYFINIKKIFDRKKNLLLKNK